MKVMAKNLLRLVVIIYGPSLNLHKMVVQKKCYSSVIVYYFFVLHTLNSLNYPVDKCLYPPNPF